MTQERVILLHGLGENPSRMALLAMALGLKGYAVTNAHYPSTFLSAEELVKKCLAPLIEKHSHQRLHFVTHSLGGILLRGYLAKYEPSKMGRVVMQAPGHHGSELIELYRRFPLSAMCGPVFQQSGTGKHSYKAGLKAPVDYELGIIAGCIPFDPVSLFTTPWPQDGRLSVESTKLDGMKDHIILPSGHEYLPFHPLAIYQTLHFLEHGSFKHALAEKENKVRLAA